MSEVKRSATDFVGYEYQKATVNSGRASQYLDCYRSFGWVQDENMVSAVNGPKMTLHLKRDRKIANRAELTRLQRHFEACIGEVEAMEKAKTSAATIWAIAVGILGTAFMAGSTFAVTHEPPIIWLCVLLAVPGFLGWALPYFVYKGSVRRQTGRLAPLIEAKYEEAYGVCEKGTRLL